MIMDTPLASKGVRKVYDYLREQSKELSAEFGFEVEKPAEEVVVTPEIERAVMEFEFYGYSASSEQAVHRQDP